MARSGGVWVEAIGGKRAMRFGGSRLLLWAERPTLALGIPRGQIVGVRKAAEVGADVGIGLGVRCQHGIIDIPGFLKANTEGEEVKSGFASQAAGNQGARQTSSPRYIWTMTRRKRSAC